MFATLTTQERCELSARLRSATRELTKEKVKLRGFPQARQVYGTDADAYADAIDDVLAAWAELLEVNRG